MEKKYDKFLMSYAAAKRAKEIIEDGIHYFPKEKQNKNEILEALQEIEENVIVIEISKDEVSEIKEEEDTLELLYSSIKKQKAAEAATNEDGLEKLLDIEVAEEKATAPVKKAKKTPAKKAAAKKDVAEKVVEEKA